MTEVKQMKMNGKGDNKNCFTNNFGRKTNHVYLLKDMGRLQIFL